MQEDSRGLNLIDPSLTQVFLSPPPQDGRLQVDDYILYINENPVMNKTFQEVLRVYRNVSSEVESSPSSPPPPLTDSSSLRPIRLIVSRSMKDKATPQSRKSTTRISAIPANRVLAEAAKLAADVNEMVGVRGFNHVYFRNFSRGGAHLRDY